MVLKITALARLPLLLVLFIGPFGASHALPDDIRCLKAVKASFEDPYGYLNSSWNFNDHTEGFICKFSGIECWHPDENMVLNIRLSGMGLKGTFPRGLRYCRSMTGLDLSSNFLNGTIPSDIGNLLPSVTTLDLSFNSFSGEIPNNLANCTYLNALKLDHNRLTGNLPKELGLLSRLKVFSVSDNMLSGPVPDFPTRNLRKDSYANNPELCDGPLKPCPPKHERKLDDDSLKIGFQVGYFLSAAAAFISPGCN